MKNYFLNLMLLIIISTASLALSAQQTISGKVMESSSSEALIGANLIIEGTTTGTVTDYDGSFSLTSSEPLPWTLQVSFTGFATQDVLITEGADDVVISLESVSILGEEIVVSASRRREKVQEAPASISVISQRQLAVSPQTNPVRNIINVPGVQIQQQSGGTINISMRGQSLLFNTEVFPILDYRNLSAAGTGTFTGGGISNIDLERIEVVRGPGSALYGPGVTAGVIHFISKSAIDSPGSSVEINAGERNRVSLFGRHAWSNADKTFGYKINAQYSRGDEFQLDLIEDAAQIAKLRNTIFEPAVSNMILDATQPGTQLLGPDDTDPDGDGNPMQDFFKAYSFNTHLEFRPQDDLTAVLSAGMNDGSGVFYNSQGEGLSNGRTFWTQGRVQKGGLFGQIFFGSTNTGLDGRPTFLYQTGNSTSSTSQQLEGQLQYNFEVPTLLNANFTAGVDLRTSKADTKNRVYGRNELDDDYQILGGYLQGKFKLADKLDMVLAGRYDSYNIVDEGTFSPRVAFVFKPSPKHTFRASYNQAYNPPTNLNVNIDFPVSTPVPGLFDIWLAGSKEAHTFDNPVIDITVPGVPDLPVNTPGLPLSIPYALVNQGVLAQLIPGLEANPSTAPLAGLIEAYLLDPANVPGGFTGNFFQYNIFNRQPFGDLTTVEPAQIAKYENYEVGYKGLINDKLAVTVDVYQVKRQGFTLFTAVGPTISLVNPDIPGDLGAAVQSGLAEYLTGIIGPDGAAAIAAIVGGAYSAGGASADASLSPLYSIFGAIESNRVPQGDGITHVAAGYRSDNESSIDYIGTDIGLQYYFSSDFSGYLNYSWTSKNRWGPGGDGDYDGDLPFEFSLNSPQNKVRFGLNFIPNSGLFGSLNAQYDEEFFGQFGQFQGTTGGQTIFDASIGYRFNDNMSVSLNGTNVFDNAYRAFPNFPQIRRTVLARFSVSF